MELTECIRTKIEQMRQKKLARHTSASAATEKRIKQLTVRRSSLFEALENELQGHPINDLEIEIAEKNGSTVITKLDTSEEYGGLVDPDAVDHQVPDKFDNSIEYSTVDAEALDEASPNESENPGQSVLVEGRPASSNSPSYLTKAERVAKLREEAAETDVRLQSERAYLQTLRALLASSLASIEKLELDLCQHSESWEAQEKDRLSIERAPASTRTKRKRETDTTSLDHVLGPHTKAARTVEAIGWMGLGSGLLYAGRACNLF
ncbi:protein of unknown function [Taphrina deformans PYCC 5710]|uniref:Uncharacterized protein n=1 Tax=Taphrina deformans (strain PYCC 5710 / ATCC 11124 / CBS 356.35 / IMI 108563 / JCM 9778 / NBRC 8474) TaxID=1097556 RepID=R4XCL0_TAPDE|nr:protein of unknown function [Taphrina deformans PYCC 5710]|eukprot:CCG83625.1 protein of unknown function [Taphrina deformans PYCC 5710]